MKAKPYTLVIVDMQECFEASGRSEVLIGVAQEIWEAKKNNYPIMIVEYGNGKDTHKVLLNLLVGYKNKSRIVKHDDDGSKEIFKTLKKKDYYSKYLRVCGVNTDCCVWATVQGLLNKMEDVKIEVVKNACGTDLTRERYDWRKYLRHANLKLV